MKDFIKLIKISFLSLQKYGLYSLIQIQIIAFDSLFKQYANKSFKFLNYQIGTPSPRLLLALINEIFINDEYLLPVEKIKNDNPVILDCGSNIGISLLYWKYKFKNPKIIAFEPFENLSNFLKNNSTKNNINVEIENVALGKDNKLISFFLDNENLTTGSSTRSRGGKYEYKVQQRKLSEYFKELDYIDLVKMDIEGAEYEVLNDLIQTNQIVKCKVYVIEFHLHIGNKESQQNFENVISNFTSLNYIYSIKSTNFRTSGFQDILILFNKI
jgi:FkbM family methyltransferase